MKQAHDWFTEDNFLKWLATQPSERVFDYTDSRGCLICSFLNDITGRKWGVGGIEYHYAEQWNPRPLPKFAYNLLKDVRMVHGKYSDLFTIEDVYLVLEQRREKEAIARIGQTAEQQADHRLLKMEKGVV